MLPTIGTLTILPISGNEHLLGAPVAAFLKKIDTTGVGVVQIDPTLSDTAQFCQAYNITPA